MQKINFQNLPNTTTPINATNLNAIQTNVEDVFNGNVAMGDITPSSVTTTGNATVGSLILTPTRKQYYLKEKTDNNYPEYYLLAKLPQTSSNNHSLLRITGTIGGFTSTKKTIIDFFVANRDSLNVEGSYNGNVDAFDLIQFKINQYNNELYVYLYRVEQYTSEIILDISCEQVTYYGNTSSSSPVGTNIYTINESTLCNNNIYSTDEVRIGTWIDGKPIYRKVFNTTTPSSDGAVATMPSYDTVVNLYGFIELTGQKIPMNYIYSTNEINSIYVEGSNIIYHTNYNNYYSKYCKIVLEYTKP